MKYFAVTELLAFLLMLCAISGGKAIAATEPLDILALGSAASERSHALAAEHSQIIAGALDQPARRLLPGGAEAWQGGRLSFSMKVDPRLQNYFTAKFWGGEADENLLVLFCDGKQIGYRHLGDIDILALSDDEPRYPGRFYYVTTPLPAAMTAGKRSVQLEIRATGRIWGYGTTFDKYQHAMTQPSRGIYSLYTHTDGCFIPPADEKQGSAPSSTRRSEPGPEVLDRVTQRVNSALARMLKSTRPLNQMELQFLAKAYTVKWTVAYQKPAAVEQIIKGVDARYAAWKGDPQGIWMDKSTWNPGWFGMGPAADAVRRLAGPLEPSLDKTIAGGLTRRSAWSQLFQASSIYLRTHRRWLTNQTMFTDVNFYLSNRALTAIDPQHAMPEAQAIQYLYQGVGLSPWLGADTDRDPDKRFGDDFFQVTRKGLTREFGYVGRYGEVGTNGAMEIYQATRQPDGQGDPQIKAQLAKMLRARAFFRYPALDDEGHAAMRLEAIIGWRDDHCPGPVVYAQRGGGEHSSVQSTAATLDPYEIGYVQQMFADNQFFASVRQHLDDKSFRSTTGLLGIPDDYASLKAQRPSPHLLPMTPGQGDFVFSDEQAGVVALKNGPDILYASLYWRAHYGVNFLARVHYLTPHYQDASVVREGVQYQPSGAFYTRRDWINFGFANGGTNIHYPRDLHQADAGEKLPIAEIPTGVIFKPGDDNHFAGRGQFYMLRYGPYLIGMNTTPDKTFDLQTPPNGPAARELVSHRSDVPPGTIEKVGPRSTVVFYFGQ